MYMPISTIYCSSSLGYLWIAFGSFYCAYVYTLIDNRPMIFQVNWFIWIAFDLLHFEHTNLLAH